MHTVGVLRKDMKEKHGSESMGSSSLRLFVGLKYFELQCSFAIEYVAPAYI